MSRTLVVEPRPIGHRAFYLSLIVRALDGGDVSLLAPPDDPRITAHFRRRGLDPGGYRFHAPRGGVIARAAELCGKHSIDRVFFAYIDELLPELAESAFPCPVSGIWFHPYALDRRYRWLPPVDKRLRQRRRIHHALRHPPPGARIDRLYFLDPGAAAAMEKLNSAVAAVPLPDPWEKLPEMTRGEARERFGLPPDRVVFLHIGSSEKRKGLSDVLEVFERFAADDGRDGRRPLLLRVGENDRLGRADRERLAALAAAGAAVVVDGFVDEADFIEYFTAADWVLLPYRSFRFSSGILSNAIAAGRPVIAADYGLIGRAVREGGNGVLFRHRSRSSLGRVMRRAIESGAFAFTFDRDAISPERFIARLAADRECA